MQSVIAPNWSWMHFQRPGQAYRLQKRTAKNALQKKPLLNRACKQNLVFKDLQSRHGLEGRVRLEGSWPLRFRTGFRRETCRRTRRRRRRSLHPPQCGKTQQRSGDGIYKLELTG